MIFKSLKIHFLYIFSSGYTYFKEEIGVHRVQRIPPTETKGRVHTSTVVVTVLDIDQYSSIELDKNDIKRITSVGSGPGGQHRNRTQSCVTLIHKPTGIEARIDEKSQNRSYQLALKILTSRVNSLYEEQKKNLDRTKKRGQFLKGERGEQIRTYDFKSNKVILHNKNNLKLNLKEFFKAKIKI